MERIGREMYLGKKILIYGYGNIGREIIEILQKKGQNIVGIVDKKQKSVDKERKLYPISEGMKLDFDQIIIAIGVEDCKSEVLFLAKQYGKDVHIANVMYEPEYYELCEWSRHKFVKNFAKKAKEDGLTGAVAECGVNNGEFAKYINMYFPESSCYLFDTFEGFHRSDVEAELRLGNEDFDSSIYKVGTFSQANVENVIKKMKYPERILIKKGHFPESAKTTNDKFLYVNLDMDLYVPQIEGLRFFWDRMVSGGMIMLHDYTAADLPGVKKAVDDFLAERADEDMKVKLVEGDCSCAIFKP